ncbi:3-galactosyl-N-acetylglucosaminide 4-alpha-L-fucosyltransferase FUT3-like [Colossoma macropomum]|uniref:3-galactosyl-N-acetylglucosaminide 4-alpha-L-fucosyltransferase FUT3-like n=1 Tax=Colossoma macropomum TaxID=42526 RepID=UPI001864D331|nr:3-galactosyl-N-acetylglucosaminide 4-alpha-L-fucosyltransferase FUT3-like [Colossoma macropomum]
MAIFSLYPSKRVRGKRLRRFAPLMPALVLLVLAVPRALAPGARLDFEDSNSEDSHAHVTLLLLWWAPFGSAHSPPNCATSYGVRGCVLTQDRDKYTRADAVIMHHRELVQEPEALPQLPRPKGQKWIWMNFESPSHSPWLDGLDRLFNLTMSYRFGSDIFLPYGYLQRRRYDSVDDPPIIHGGNNINPQMSHHSSDPRADRHGNDHNGHLTDHHGNRSNHAAGHHSDNSPVWQHRGQSGPRHRALVAWVISNWSEKQERVQFYWRLRRYIRVDIYGRRALRLVNNSVLQTISSYKFYLAFENSLHTDYITEKLWRNALQTGAVPVVLGPSRENYERFLPPDAFIHVHDFKSPRALAAYLMYLDQNPAQYRRYLAWRQDYSVHVTSFWAEHYCAACQAVQASRKQQKTVKHLEIWFNS